MIMSADRLVWFDGDTAVYVDPTSRSIWPRIEHSINLGNKTIDDDRKDLFDDDATATNKLKRGKSKEEILKHHVELDDC
jgi:hypothetical protein